MIHVDDITKEKINEHNHSLKCRISVVGGCGNG